MRQWFDADPEYFRKEQAAVATEQPGLSLEIVPKGTRVTESHSLTCDRAICRGKYALRVPDSDRSYDYSITVITHATHPEGLPTLCCNDTKLPSGNLARHIMSDGTACLGVGAEIKRRLHPENGLVGMFHDLVSPFLAWQVYYETNGHAPPTGQRAHFGKGILEFYAEDLGLPDLSGVPDFMKLLAKQDRPKGHLICPCGSGKKLRDCHGDLIWRARENLPWQHVRDDFAQLDIGKDARTPLIGIT